MRIETFGENSSWKKKGKKTGGARGAGALGGIYSNGINTALIKQDQESPNFDIAEYMSSKIFAAVSPGAGAVVEMMVPEGELEIPGDGSDVYVRSEFFDNYSDMFKDMDTHMSENNKPSQWFRKDGRPLFMGTRQKFTNVMSKAIDNLGYEGFEKIAPGSLLVGDFDMHIGNIGVIRESDKKPQLKRIDFGWGFSNLTKDVNPHSVLSHFPGRGPTNHFREFPLEYKLTKEFAKGLDQAANTGIAAILDESFSKLEKYYNQSVLQKWAQHAMPQEFGNKKVDEIDLFEVRNTLKEVMQARQSSLRDFSMEIKLGLVINPKRKEGGEVYVVNSKELIKLVKENPEYFAMIAADEKKIKFWDERFNKSSKYEKLLKKEIIKVRSKIIKEALVTEASVVRKPQVHVPSQELVQQPRLPKNLQEQIRNPSSQPKKPVVARDSVWLANQLPGPSVNLNDVIDPIIQAIRTEIIVTQQLLLQQEIAKEIGGSERNTFVNKDLVAIQKYLKTEEGRQAVVKIMKSPELQTKMHKMESSGYQAVHTRFKDDLHDVEWGQKEANQVRLTNITNNSGYEVCTLEETTISTQSTGLELANGTIKMVKSCRQIDFPKTLKVNHGPMHVLMALQDESGCNMPEKNTVYFSAHYDDSGKLTEVSSPIPVKFMGKNKNAIGYIERDGKVYTLPVTQGKYHEMMQEVAKNNGMNIDLTQEVKKSEQRAVDQVIIAPEQLSNQLALVKKLASQLVGPPSISLEQSASTVKPRGHRQVNKQVGPPCWAKKHI